MRKEITIESKIHNTYAALRPRWVNEEKGLISRRAVKAATDKCCGMSDCCCPITVETDGWEIVRNDNGSWEIVPSIEW